jgi:hypothetical protein
MGWTLPHEHDKSTCAMAPINGLILSFWLPAFFVLGAIYAGLAILPGFRFSMSCRQSYDRRRRCRLRGPDCRDAQKLEIRFLLHS